MDHCAKSSADRAAQSALSRAHSTTTANSMYSFPAWTLRTQLIALPVSTVIKAASDHIAREIETVQQLSKVASQHPYYRFNYAWSRQMESVVREDCSSTHAVYPANESSQCFSILLCGWLGGFGKSETGQLLTIEEVGQILQSTSSATIVVMFVDTSC